MPTSMSPLMSDIPSFRIRGLVVDMRELMTKEKKVWAYAVKIMAMGGTFELTTPDEKLWKTVAVGTAGEATGRFENFSGTWRFILTAFNA